MSFFNTLLQSKGLPKHDGRPLWKYMLNDLEYNKLVHELKFTKLIFVDARDATLFYAEWWKRNYNGGKPSKQDVFSPLKDTHFYFYHEDFFKLAKRGAQMLGVKWIKKQNTLYFKTLLLQGGLPLSHISENQSNYLNFLLAVLDEQPEVIEDFIFKPHIINYLPESSQNDIIYESCFEIVKSILNKEDIYDELFKENEALKTISDSLKVREKTLVREQRQSKPKNYWILSFKNGKIEMSLRIGLANSYNIESLSNMLGFEATGNEYQFYLNDELICVFKKMLNGSFKTDWYQQQNIKWNGDNSLPYTYVLIDGKKIEVTDFIQTIPNIHEPSLWAKFSDNEWRLIKGNGTSNIEAAILFPKQWKCDLPAILISINNINLSWLNFEGEIEITSQDENRKFLSGVNSFDWTIVSQKPNWILKSSMPVIQNKLAVIVYDENDKMIPDNKYEIWIKKHNSIQNWGLISDIHNLPLGCVDIKIQKDEIFAFDTFFNSGNLSTKYKDKSIDKATIEILNLNGFEFKLDESQILEINQTHNSFSLKVKTEFSKIPNGVKGSIGYRNQKKLFFEMTSPFEGMAIIDKEGKIIDEVEQLSIANLYGLRILSTPNTETLISLKNRIKLDVKISKEIKESSQPVLSFKDEILRLFYLADAMDYRNKVCLELIEGKNSKTYEISGFTHTLKVDEQLQNKVCLYNSTDELDLFAIPLNCLVNDIALIPLVKDDNSYLIPNTEITNQFIIISSKENDNQLMPRFVNTNENFESVDKEKRIENYHSQLLEGSFNDEIWKQLLVYFNLCVENDIPFSTFDQLRAISRNSEVAARAFFFIGINQTDIDNFIQNAIPELEKDLGFCFHWINKDHWEIALNEVDEIFNNEYFDNIISLLSSYMQENGMDELFKFISGANIEKETILHSNIRELRAKLGERVLKELPYATPKIVQEYHIPIKDHLPVKLLLRAPIAVAESINDIQKEYPIWAGDDHRESIRRNIQYSQYLNPEFYNRTILHTLKDSQ